MMLGNRTSFQRTFTLQARNNVHVLSALQHVRLSQEDMLSGRAGLHVLLPYMPQCAALRCYHDELQRQSSVRRM